MAQSQSSEIKPSLNVSHPSLTCYCSVQLLLLACVGNIMSRVISILLQKSDPNYPWGFTVIGGRESGFPIRIDKVRHDDRVYLLIWQVKKSCIFHLYRFSRCHSLNFKLFKIKLFFYLNFKFYTLSFSVQIVFLHTFFFFFFVIIFSLNW